MARSIRDFTDDELADVGGMPGSLEDYRRNFEFKRRNLTIQRSVAEAQIKASKWTMISAITVGISVVVTALGILIQL